MLDEKKLKLFSYIKANSIDQELEKLNEIPKQIVPDDLVINIERDKRIIERLDHDLLNQIN